MAGLSDYYENKVIDHMLRGQAFTPPSTIYVGLYTTAPTDAGGGTEVSGNGYARQSVTLTAASGGSTSNASDITFPQATGDWGTIVAVGLFDASTGGNLLAWSNLTESKTINAGDVLKIPAGQLTFTID
ncbi:MAG: hypothetical protein QXV73_03880 [Candidatus Micrarchaeia archaeon]